MIKSIISASQAAALIKDETTITTGGFGSCGHPETLTGALKERFLQTNTPRNLSLVFAAGQGDRGVRGLNQLSHRGLIKKVIGGYWSLTPELSEMALKGHIQAYNWPQGVISHLFRAIAAGKPGVISPIGLHTFVDPRQGGGKLNDKTQADLVEVVTLQGKEQLFYPALSIHYAFLRGTIADENGNISMQDEATFQDNLAQAQAVHNSGGIVIVQVLNVVKAGSLPAHSIRIPGIFVDYLVIAREDEHWQTYGERFNRFFTGNVRSFSNDSYQISAINAKKIIARRAYLEALKYDNPVINLGIGLPEYLSKIAREEDYQPFTLTVESGAIGGYPAGELSFGASIDPHVVLEQASQFDFYDGGGIDLAFLGFGQVDQHGHVNVSHLGDRLNGVGGFINIAQSAKRTIFCGTFTASGLEIAVQSGKLNILKEGKIKKFVKEVNQINFNANYKRSYQNEEITYITERAVLKLINNQLTLVEIAPGIDIQRDILDQSNVKIVVSKFIRQMDDKIFLNERMNFQAKKIVNEVKLGGNYALQ